MLSAFFLAAFFLGAAFFFAAAFFATAFFFAGAFGRDFATAPNPAAGRAHFGGSALALDKLTVLGWHPFAGLDLARLNKEGIAPLKPQLARIDGNSHWRQSLRVALR